MKAVILAGGFGKRLRPLTNVKPKPLILVSGIPILLWQIDWLKKHGVNEIIICAGYLKERIFDYIGDGSKFGVSVKYAIEETPLGTGGALRNAEKLLNGEQEAFLMLNGDILTNLDPQKLRASLDEGHALASIAVIPLPSPYGVIDIEDTGVITGFREKPRLDGYWINAGIYCLSPKILESLPKQGNIETTAFPDLAKKGLIKATRYKDVVWRSIDSHKDIEEAEKELKHELDLVANEYNITHRQSDAI
ncbi:MAG: nucleotidyltransferase family protein [Thaumarchaeota archaeon]|nr:nucleotidyltransferase family protein [Nitrososphaerota archaeon]MCL5317703.1 nucleotidyltransferase family protein [Nitrososphaerota archaeon]